MYHKYYMNLCFIPTVIIEENKPLHILHEFHTTDDLAMLQFHLTNT